MNLRIPGPTPLPPAVREAGSKQMINHRGPQFSELLFQVTRDLKEMFLTKNDLVLFACSGTGGLEAAIANLFSPGDKLLAVSIGYFGERFATIASRFGANVVKLEYAQGQAANPIDIAAKLREHPDVRGVLVTHNETSTGVTNDLAAIAEVVRRSEALFLVDGVSSIGSIELRSDDWGCDIVISGSQKSWMSPPGVSMVSVSPRAWEFHARAKMPRFYFDFTAARKSAERGQTPWTPAVGILFGIQSALELMKAEGLENIWARHHKVGAYTRKGLKSLGLELLADERCASDTVTAFKTPPGVSSSHVLKRLREEFDTELTGGQGNLEETVVRIGHLGYVDVPDIEPILQALKVVLER